MFQKARKSTKQYHIKLYKNNVLFRKGTWLEKSEQDILNIGKKLSNKHNLRILDLGSGIGRNAIPLAQTLQNNKVSIICVDYLTIAIKKLHEYAKKYYVEKNISSYISPVENFFIKKNNYDYIISHGVLAHVKNKQTLLRVLKNIAKGVKKEGYVYLSIASDLEETEIKTKKKLKPLIEVYLSSTELIEIYKKIFKDWTIELLRKDPYTEYYEKDRKKIKWKCNFMTLVAKKETFSGMVFDKTCTYDNILIYGQ